MKRHIHIHLNAPVAKTQDAQKPYISSTKEGWEVLGNKGQLVKSFPKTEAGRTAARLYLEQHYDKLVKSNDALSLAEAERELKYELKLIEVFKKSGKPVPREMLERKKMLEEIVSRLEVGDAIGETFPTLAAAKAKVEKLADMGIRAKVNQEVDEATKKMYFVVVRLSSGDAGFTEYNPREVARLKGLIKELNSKMDAIVGSGGRIAMNDPLLIKQRSLLKELTKYRGDK